MGEFVSISEAGGDVGLTAQEVQALIDTALTNEKRKWIRRLFYTNNNFTAGAWAPVGAQGGSPNGGTRSTGSSITLLNGMASLGLTAGINKSCQVLESHGQDTDIFVANDGVKEYWGRNTTVRAMLSWGSTASGMIGTPASDTYVALEMNGYNGTLPMPTPPTADGSSDPCIMLRARMDTGAWELYQSQANSAVARLDVLTGVRTLGRLGSDNLNADSVPMAFKLEIQYTPTAITAKVDGVTGVVAPNILANSGLGLTMSHVGAGVSVWTGSSGTASFSQQLFYDVVAETEYAI